MGFFGFNGVGKIIIMKILIGFIFFIEGIVEVCGLFVLEEFLVVWWKIGYLLEYNFLYKDMYVKEYLWFVVGMY